MSERADIEACATRLLSQRDHCANELRTKLRARRFPAETIDAVIADLVTQGYIDDEAFARHQARLLAEQGWGPVQISGKLEQHGVERRLARGAVDELDVDWLASASARLARKFGELSSDDRERAFRHLVHRGFTPTTARRAIFG